MSNTVGDLTSLLTNQTDYIYEVQFCHTAACNLVEWALLIMINDDLDGFLNRDKELPLLYSPN